MFPCSAVCEATLCYRNMYMQICPYITSLYSECQICRDTCVISQKGRRVQFLRGGRRKRGRHPSKPYFNLRQHLNVIRPHFTKTYHNNALPGCSGQPCLQSYLTGKHNALAISFRGISSLKYISRQLRVSWCTLTR